MFWRIQYLQKMLLHGAGLPADTESGHFIIGATSKANVRRLIVTGIPQVKRISVMDMIKVTGYLPDTAKNPKHKSAAAMQQLVNGMAEANGGKLAQYEVPEPGTALLLVMGEAAMQFIMKEFRALDNVNVSLVPALGVSLVKNRTLQTRANSARERMKEVWQKARPNK